MFAQIYRTGRDRPVTIYNLGAKFGSDKTKFDTML